MLDWEDKIVVYLSRSGHLQCKEGDERLAVSWVLNK
jgi:hypothetical protein